MQLGNWIPQFFYDLIGRVVPGAVISMSSYFLLQDFDQAKTSLSCLFRDSGIPAAALYLVGFLVSYVVGTLLGAIGFAFEEKEWTTHEVASLEVEVPDPKKPPDSSDISYIYDAIMVHNPAGGSRLAKLQGEKHMCRVLIVGFVLLVVFHCCRHWEEWGSVLWGHYDYYGRAFWGPIGLLLFGIVTSYLFYIHLAIRSTRLMLNYWHLMQHPQLVKQRGTQTRDRSPKPDRYKRRVRW